MSTSLEGQVDSAPDQFAGSPDPAFSREMAEGIEALASNIIEQLMQALWWKLSAEFAHESAASVGFYRARVQAVVRAAIAERLRIPQDRQGNLQDPRFESLSAQIADTVMRALELMRPGR